MATKQIGISVVFAALASVLFATGGCSSATTDDDVASTTGALVSCSITGKQQHDNSHCQWDNCGATSAAMMRDAMTCGAENYSGGQMRIYYDEYVGLDAKTPSCLDHAGGLPGTDASRIGGLLENISKYDKGANYASTTTYYSSISLSSIESYLSNGYVAVIAGGGNGNAAPCGFTEPHSIFVQQYDAGTDKFLVYDPCCSATCTSKFNGTKSPQWWPASKLNAWDMPGVTIGKGASPPVKCGTTTCKAGDFCSGTKCCDGSCVPGCPC